MMGELVGSDARGEFLFEGSTLLTHGNGLASCETDLLDRMDSYWDDIETGVIISRMVSDSVNKGMVSAVAEEAAERITLMEAEMAFLKERLRYYESGAGKGNELDSLSSMLHSCSLRASGENSHASSLDRVLVAAEEELQTVEVTGSGSRTDTILSEIDDMISPLMSSSKELEEEIQNLINSLQDELETKLSEHTCLVNNVNKKWRETVCELSVLRQEVDALSKALLSTEVGLHVSRASSLEKSEECNTVKSMDHLARVVSGNHHLLCTPLEGESCTIKAEESSKPMPIETLKHMPPEGLIAYYKNEMTKMKRQHDLVLQEKTEELFSFKREFLKEKGSSSFHFRRDKEFDLLMRKIRELMSKLGDICLENVDFPGIHNYDRSMLFSLKEKINTLSLENQRLHCLLKDKLRGARCFASQVSVVKNYPSREETLIKQIKELQSDMEDGKIKSDFEGEILNLVSREVITGFKTEMEGLEMAAKTEQDIYLMLYREAAEDAMSHINPIVAESQQEMNSIAARLAEREESLSLEIKGNTTLKQEIESLYALMAEKEKFALEVELRLIQEKDRFDGVCQELSILNKRVNEQERLISESKRESDMMRDKLDEAMQQIHQYEFKMSEVNENLKSTSNALGEAEKQIHQYEFKMSEVNEKLKSTSNALGEAEKQNIILATNIQEKENTLVSAITRVEEREKRMETIINSMSEFSNAIGDSESRLVDKIKVNESRLESMKHQCLQLVQEGNLLKSKELCYKQRLERQRSDLQKAESEVDLLGDDVDALMSLLKKIHIALDHYSPVLQHYPGVVEVLKLIKREMKGDIPK